MGSNIAARPGHEAGCIQHAELVERLVKRQKFIFFWFKYNLGQKYDTPQVRPDRGSNS